MVPGCAIIGHWPNSWETSKAGVYNHTVYYGTGVLASSWEVCIGNGYTTSVAVGYYTGSVQLKALTTFALPPTPVPTTSKPTVTTNKNRCHRLHNCTFIIYCTYCADPNTWSHNGYTRPLTLTNNTPLSVPNDLFRAYT
jgi:hypothetical protein